MTRTNKVGMIQIVDSVWAAPAPPAPGART